MGCPARIRGSDWPMGGSDRLVGGSRTADGRYRRTRGTRPDEEGTTWKLVCKYSVMWK
jgi:hypothetical protein